MWEEDRTQRSREAIVPLWATWYDRMAATNRTAFIAPYTSTTIVV